jgi:uncharacterized protein YjbI with pentapeptide repeats
MSVDLRPSPHGPRKGHSLAPAAIVVVVILGAVFVSATAEPARALSRTLRAETFVSDVGRGVPLANVIVTGTVRLPPVITKPIKCIGCDFDGAFDARGVALDGELDLTGAVFFRAASFSGAAFKEDATFSGAFFQSAKFDSARFLKAADFGGADFGSDANFRSARFYGGGSFVAAGFDRDASFRSGHSYGTTNFDQTYWGPFHPGSGRQRPPSADFTDFTSDGSMTFRRAIINERFDAAGLAAASLVMSVAASAHVADRDARLALLQSIKSTAKTNQDSDSRTTPTTRSTSSRVTATRSGSGFPTGFSTARSPATSCVRSTRSSPGSFSSAPSR